MHRDEAANASCAQTGLKYIEAFYNETRINALIRELAQPAPRPLPGKGEIKIGV